MLKCWILSGLLLGLIQNLYAQNWTAQDSLRLHQMLQQTGELELNIDVLKALDGHVPMGNPLAAEEKPWLDFKEDLPLFPVENPKKVVLTLHPYTLNTSYNWDPVRQCIIKVDKNTWRGPFYELKTRVLPTNWAKNPWDAGDRSSLEKIEATGMLYEVKERVHNRFVGGWTPAASGVGINGLDLMAPFTREFWQFRRRKNRKRTLQVLRAYAIDSVTVH